MSKVAIAGGHGKIAMLLGALLAGRGDTPRGLIRNPDQEGDLRAAGIEPVLCDLEGDGDVAAAVRGADAVVFAAGAGAGSGEARKTTMDFEGAVKLIEAAKAEGISRYLIVSSMGAGDPPADGADSAGGDDVFGAYLRAKAAADEALRASGLDFTIVRPGGFTDDPGTGLVAVAEHLERGQIPRADVAAVLLACLDTPSTIGRSFDLTSGDTPIADALRG
jgi:nucleoside-diphosphate-sugar epimerase